MDDNQKELKAVSQRENGHEAGSDSRKPDETLAHLPHKEKKELIQTITRFSGIFPPQHPIADKITPDHISALLQNTDTCDQRDREERQQERNYNFKVLVTVILSTILVCGLFIWTKQTDFLKYFIGALFGFGGGFGVGKFYKKEA